MPMDRYARQSHKTNQRARRRNNTAQYLLENQLKQLDRELRSGQVAYQRNLNRMKSELSGLEGASSDFNLPLDEDPKRTRNADPDFLHFNDTETRPRHPSYNYNPSVLSTTNLQTKNTPSTDNSAVLSSASFMTSSAHDLDFADKSNNENDDVARTSLPCLASSTPVHTTHATTNRNQTFNHHHHHYNNNKIAKPTQKPSSIPSSLSSSPSSKNNPLNHNYNSSNSNNTHHQHKNKNRCNCNLFPCKLPQTYHTLGFRRDDLCPRTDDDCNDDLSPLTLNPNTIDQNILKPHSDRKAKNSTDPTTTTTTTTPISSPRTDHTKPAPNTTWIKMNQAPSHSFAPIVNGPVFGYRPADPVLERIRHHRKEPMLNATRPCARVTIRDRIRGVKQLVKEMKMTNEKAKPEDWATNYGKRVSTRVLLNPVVPV